MLTTLAILSSHVIVALLARKRKLGFSKALVMSFFLTPFLTLPVVLRSKKIPDPFRQDPPQQQGTADSPNGGNTEVEAREESDGNRYGYREGGRVISDSFILSESDDKILLGQRVPQERRQSISADVELRDRSMHI